MLHRSARQRPPLTCPPPPSCQLPEHTQPHLWKACAKPLNMSMPVSLLGNNNNPCVLADDSSLQESGMLLHVRLQTDGTASIGPSPPSYTIGEGDCMTALALATSCQAPAGLNVAAQAVHCLANSDAEGTLIQASPRALLLWPTS